ncbi:hypothetical protein [Magnetospirillum molischianum]|nr:hypothetical protein [Magnetospirillum molischianum]
MNHSATIIDFTEIRRRRQLAAAPTPSVPEVVWVPVWVMLPVWQIG